MPSSFRKQPGHQLATRTPDHVRTLSGAWCRGAAATHWPSQLTFKMLSVKLPRLFSIDQMPQVCALTPVVDMQPWQGCGLCNSVTALSSTSLLCAGLLSSRSPPQTPRDESLLFPHLHRTWKRKCSPNRLRCSPSL